MGMKPDLVPVVALSIAMGSALVVGTIVVGVEKLLARPSEPPKQSFGQMMHGAGFWKVGPVVIEAQRIRSNRLVGHYPIMRIDEDGQIWRNGKTYLELDVDGLRGLVRDLADFEVEKSRPPTDR